MYHGIEPEYLEEYATTIKNIQETGVVKIKLQFQDDRIGDIEDLESCITLCRESCIALEKDKEEYIKHGILSLFNKKEREEKIAAIEKEKQQFVKFIDFYENLKIYHGEIIKQQIEVGIERSKELLYLKFEREENAIKFALTFLVAYPECMYKE